MLFTIFAFLVILSVLVIVHELGHFCAAKKAGIRVEEFGFGYPPRVIAKKIGETVYSVNWILFGGFVKLYGEELGEEGKKEGEKRAFWATSKKIRTGVILAGVAANFILAIFLFSILYSFSGIPVETNQTKVVGIVPGSPAEAAGVKEGDLVLMVDSRAVDSLDDFVQWVNQKSGEKIEMTVVRSEERLSFVLTPRENPPEGEGPLGVVVSNMEMKMYPFWQMPFRGAIEGLKEAFGWTGLILNGLGRMLVDLFTLGKVPKDIAGPVGIFQVTGVIARTGIINFLRFMGILSVNLAIVNILPFPAIDGGRLLFILYEAVARRRPKPEFERWVNAMGMTFLMFLIVLVTINDVDRLVDFGNLWEKIKSQF